MKIAQKQAVAFMLADMCTELEAIRLLTWEAAWMLDAGKPVTGENIKAALETIQNFDTQGITSPISFSPTSHKGNNSLRLYQVVGGKWTQISDFISATP